MAFMTLLSSGAPARVPAGRRAAPGQTVRLLLTLTLLATGGCNPFRKSPPADPGPARGPEPIAARLPAASGPMSIIPAAGPQDRVVPLVLSNRLFNNLEACGCTSEPLGDVARLGALVRGSNALLLDAGGLRYAEDPTPVDKLPQARQKADFLESTWNALGALTMLQPEDLRGSPDGSELAGRHRVASNVSGLPPGAVVPEAVRVIGGIKIGVLGLADSAASWPPGVTVSEPIAAAQAGVRRLRAQGAQVLVALTGLRREQARRLARKVPGLQLVVPGGDGELKEGVEQPEVLGETVLVVPGQKGEYVIRLELHLSPKGQPVWAVYPSPRQQEQRTALLRQKLQAAQTRLSTLRADPAADPTFVQTTAAEVERLQAELATATAPLTPPPGGYVVAERLPITRALPRDPGIAAEMTALDRRIGEANLAASAGPPPPLPPGQPRYLGNAGCLGACHYHSDAVEFWQKTRHASAWKTLVEAGKDLSYDCVGCHAIGFELPGGGNLWTLAQWQRAPAKFRPQPSVGPDLRNLQCEGCHGPGSLHARAPSKVPMPTPKPTEERCRSCHTKEHSDTFDFSPYLRDILGPGHGEDRRRELGDGPTGHELRSAALRAHAPH